MIVFNHVKDVNLKSHEINFLFRLYRLHFFVILKMEICVKKVDFYLLKVTHNKFPFWVK